MSEFSLVHLPLYLLLSGLLLTVTDIKLVSLLHIFMYSFHRFAFCIKSDKPILVMLTGCTFYNSSCQLTATLVHQNL